MPAAGWATRLGLLEGSKEMLPVSLAGSLSGLATSSTDEPVCRSLLQAFRDAGVERVVVVLRPEKQDLRNYLEGEPVAGLASTCVSVPGGTSSVPETLDRAHASIRGQRVALGFPDCLFHPSDAFSVLEAEQRRVGADLMLGLFPAPRPSSTDMVRYEESGQDSSAGSSAGSGRVLEIQVRPRETTLKLNWLLAVWGPAFTEFLHQEVGVSGSTGELQLGTLFQRALHGGLSVHAVPFPRGGYWDIGTPEDYARVRAGSSR